jgi:hypothetical protein
MSIPRKSHRSSARLRAFGAFLVLLIIFITCKSPVGHSRGKERDRADYTLSFIVSGASSGAGRLLLPTATNLTVSLRRSGSSTDDRSRTVAISSGAATVAVAFDDLATGTYTVAASAYVDPGTPLFVQTAEVELSPETEELVLNLVPTNPSSTVVVTDQTTPTVELAPNTAQTWLLPSDSVFSAASVALLDGTPTNIHLFIQALDGTLIGNSVDSIAVAAAAGGARYATVYNGGSISSTLKLVAGPAMAEIPAGTEYGMPVNAFRMGRYEVTQAQFRIVMGYTSEYYGPIGDDYPISEISFYDALAFCNALSILEGLDPVYNLTGPVKSANNITSVSSLSTDFSENGYRIPLRSERVWAARGGAVSTYFWGESVDQAPLYAWVNGGASDFRTVGQLLSNGYGLYDMVGNIWEWTWGSDSIVPNPYRSGGTRSSLPVEYIPNAGGTLAPGQINEDNGFRVARSDTEGIFTHETLRMLDFESLSPGDLNGQDGWTTTIYPPGGYTPVDMQVSASALAPNTSRVLSNDIVGASAGVDASRPLSLGEQIDLANPDNTYRLTFDTVKSAWGSITGFAYDADSSGTVTKNDAVELALLVMIDITSNLYTLTLPDGSIQTQSAAAVASDSWVRVQLILHSGTVTVRADPGITGAWTTLWTDLPMGTDTGSSTKTNPALWDQLFIHMEGAGNKADNIRLEKIVAP